MIQSSYLHNSLCTKERKLIVDEICQLLKQKLRKQTYGIVFRGMSGALIAPSVANKLNKPILMIRKNRSSHSEWDVEGELCDKYVFVDDFCQSGKTLAHVCKKTPGSIIGVVLYNTGKYGQRNGYIPPKAYEKLRKAFIAGVYKSKFFLPPEE